MAIDSGGYVTSSFRSLIVAYCWMLPKEIEMLYLIEQVCQGNKV